MELLLSEKYKDFLKYNSSVFEILEGTTASGKTTTGVVKFMLKVAQSKQKLHIISGQDLGVVEKNIINCDLGILDIFGDLVEYNPKGKGEHTLAHLIYKTSNGDKVIYILGYDNISRWKKALGGQYGCVYIDEMNTADMAYVRQVAMRCDYLMGTLNPDDPEKEIYKEYINRCRPIKKYENDAPQAILQELTEPPMEGWVWWYFSFEHNLGLTKEKIDKIKSTHTPGSADYKHYIEGIRGKAEGVIFSNFETKKHLITEQQASELIKGSVKNKGEYFTIFSSGLDTSYSKNSNDTIAMSFIGITNKQRVVVLDEEVLNNKLEKTPFAPSDIVIKYVDFLEKNRIRYGLSLNVFIDNADQATITELKKYKSEKGIIYNFNNAHKKLKIIDRIVLQSGWISTGHFVVVDNCKNYIKELQTYSWSDKKNKTEPEDANDHMINSVQYAWIPFKKSIGFI